MSQKLEKLLDQLVRLHPKYIDLSLDRLLQLLDILKTDNDFTRMNGILYRENGSVKKIMSSGWYREINTIKIPKYKGPVEKPVIPLENSANCAENKLRNVKNFVVPPARLSLTYFTKSCLKPIHTDKPLI